METAKGEAGGAREDRTPDLLRAKQALSQLSYGPNYSYEWRGASCEEELLGPRPSGLVTDIGGSGWI